MYDTAKRVALVKQQAVVVTVFCTRLRKHNKQQEQTKEDEET